MEIPRWQIYSKHDDLEVLECFKKHYFGSAFVLQPLTRSIKFKKTVEVINQKSRFEWRPLPYTLTKLFLFQTQMVIPMGFSKCPLSKHVALLCKGTTHHLIRSISSTTSDLKTTFVKGGAAIRGGAGN